MGLEVQADTPVERRLLARWVSSGRAWMQKCDGTCCWLTVLLFRDRQRSQATQWRCVQGIGLFSLAACGVSCQDPWDERGWVSIYHSALELCLLVIGQGWLRDVESVAGDGRPDGRCSKDKTKQPVSQSRGW